MASRLQRHQERLLALLPEDGATLGNQRLWERFKDVSAQATGRQRRSSRPREKHWWRRASPTRERAAADPRGGSPAATFQSST